MDIERRIRRTRDLTPTEQQMATCVLAMGDRLQGYSIKEFARAANASIASVHRFCKKLGLEGFKELKVEVARSSTRTDADERVDINFPFEAGDGPGDILRRLESVYGTTLRETRELIDMGTMDRAAELMLNASSIDIYTCSHNLYPARMFCDRLLSIGRQATCHESVEQQVRTALASGSDRVAIAISYSGLSPNFIQLLPVLKQQQVPTVLIGTAGAQKRNPGLDAYLTLSDSESLQNRITQFASHIAVQYVLDALFSCLFAHSYDKSNAFLTRSLPYTRLQGIVDDR